MQHFILPTIVLTFVIISALALFAKIAIDKIKIFKIHHAKPQATEKVETIQANEPVFKSSGLQIKSDSNKPYIESVSFADSVAVLDKNVRYEQIGDLIRKTRSQNKGLEFVDNVFRNGAASPIVFSYSILKGSKFGWEMRVNASDLTGIIFAMGPDIMAKQILSLAQKNGNLEVSIKSTGTALESERTASDEMNQEVWRALYQAHNETQWDILLLQLKSKEPIQITHAAQQICSKSQARESLMPLTHVIDEIEAETVNIQLGGMYAPNSRFLAGAISVLKFHRDSNECTCNVYGAHDCMDPNEEASSGYLKICETIHYKDSDYVDYYLAECTRCGNKFQIAECNGYYTSWTWKITQHP